MTNHWIIIADAAEARAYAESGRHRPLELVRTWENASGREHASAIDGDANERASEHSPRTRRSAMYARMDIHDQIVERFARRLVADLKSEYDAGSFCALSLVAPAYLLNEIRPLLGRRLEHRLNTVMIQDLVRYGGQELYARLEGLLTPSVLYRDSTYPTQKTAALAI